MFTQKFGNFSNSSRRKKSFEFNFVLLQNKKFMKWLVEALKAEIPLFAKKSKMNQNLKLNTLTHLISFSFNYWFWSFVV